MRRAVLQLLMGVGLFLGTAEVAVRVALVWPPSAERLAADTEAGRRLVMLDRASRLAMVSFFGTGTVMFDPELGWVGRPDVVMPGALRVTTTHLGGRTTAEGPRTGPRLLVFGDSFTFGHEVADADTWAWQLSERTGAEVLDHAVLGYGLDQIVLRAERDLPDVRPVRVVVGLNQLALDRSVRRWDSWAKPRLVLEGGVLVREPVGQIPPPDQLVPALWAPRLPTWFSVLAEALQPRPGRDASDPLVEPLLARLVAAASAVGASVTVVWLPLPAEIGTSGVPASVLRAPSVRSGAVQVVDTDAAFVAARARGQDLVVGTHWSREGHAVVADVLAPHIMEVAAPTR